MLRSLFTALSVLLTSIALATPPPSLLPQSFSGWRMIEHKTGTNPAQADASNAALLREYGFTDYESATYTRDRHRLQIKAARFTNATGSLGAYSLYRQPEMERAQIGDSAVVSGDHVLFYRANILLDAVFERPTAMSAAELRSFAEELQVVSGGAAGLPSPVQYLPTQSYIDGSSKYVVGPIGLAKIDSPLPAGVVDFAHGAEVAQGAYRTSHGTARLMILSYPTPQIAMARMKVLVEVFGSPSDPSVTDRAHKRAAQARKSGLQGTVTLPVSSNADVTFRRTGPMIVFISGPISPSEAISLAQSVNYDATVRWTERAPVTTLEISNLIVGIFALIAILIGVFLVLGFFFGGLPLLLRKFFPKHKFRDSQDAEIIKLNLSD